MYCMPFGQPNLSAAADNQIPETQSPSGKIRRREAGMIENNPSPGKSFNPWHFIWITVVLSELFTILLNTIQHHFNPQMDLRYLLKVGAVDALFVPLLVAPVIMYFMRSESELKNINMRLEHEIAARKRTDEGLRESESRFRSIFNGAMDGIILMDAANRKFIMANKTMCAMLRSAEDELVTLRPEDIHPAEALPRVKMHLEEAAQGKASVAQGLPVMRRDGSIFYADISATTLTLGGRLHFMGVFRDITARKHADDEKKSLQAQLLHAHKMEAIGQLAGGVAHDFNNILTAIIGYASLLQMKMAADDPLRAHVDHLLHSAGRASQLTQSLLTFSRKQVLTMAPVSINGIIAGQEQFLRRIIGEDIEMRTVMRGDAVIMADSGQIEQVLMNLATNARDAMPKGGLLTIGTDVFEMTDAFISAHGFGVPGTYALISITDTGVGMDEETKHKIFEPFFTTKEVGRGTGLGMAILYGIIKQHNGFITVDSTVGKGTTFALYFPVYRGQVEVKEKVTAAPSKIAGTETVLLAEDESTLRAYYRDILVEHGYTVVIAEDGEDAIRKFRERKDEIQVCVIDVIMPKKNGKDVYDEIQKIKSGTNVIFSSGYTADKVLQERLPAESEFIAKPTTPQEFLKKIRDVLDGHRAP
jgi:PAS domain S-box-containing protein